MQSKLTKATQKTEAIAPGANVGALLQTLPARDVMDWSGKGWDRVGLQGASLRGRDRTLGRPVVPPLWRELPRPRADDG